MALSNLQKGELYSMSVNVRNEILSNQQRNTELTVELARIQALLSDTVIDNFGEEIEDVQLQKIFTKTKEKITKLKIKPGIPKNIVKE